MGCVCTHLQHCLRLRKIFAAHQRFMSPLYHDPVFGPDTAAQMDLVIHGPGKLLGHISLIDRVGQDAPDGLGIPQTGEAAAAVPHLLAGRRGRDLFAVEHMGDPGTAIPTQKQRKDALYRGCCFLIRQQMISVRRVNAVPIGSLPPQEFSLPFEDAQRSPHLGAGIGGVKIVEYVLEHRHLLRAVGISGRVVLIVDRDKADAQPWKNLFQIAPGFGIVAPQAGKILDDHAPNAAIEQTVLQRLEPRTLKIRTCMAIVHKLPLDRKTVLPRPLPQEGALVLDRIRFRRRSVRR